MVAIKTTKGKKMKEKIEKALMDSGKKLTQVSRETGIAYTTIFDWKNGRTKDIGFKKLKKIAAALGTTPERLVDDDD